MKIITRQISQELDSNRAIWLQSLYVSFLSIFTVFSTLLEL